MYNVRPLGRQKRRWSGPIILPQAVKRFRERELWSYNWLKQVPRLELFSSIREPKWRFYTNPRDCQLVCFTIATSVPDFLFLLDMGAGKTKLTLDALWYRRIVDGLGKTIVVVPSAESVLGWQDQIAEHRPEFKSVALMGGKEERIEDLLDKYHDTDIFLINYQGLMSYMTSLEQGKKSKRVRQIDHRIAQRLAELFDAVVLDEIHRVGNKNSLIFRMCDALCKRAKVRYGLTGTPFGRDPERLWAQFYLIDRGATLGPTLGLFRAAFFTAEDNYFGGVDYTFDEKHADLLYQTLNNRSIRYEDKEFSDLPAVNYVKHRLTFGTDAEDYYKQVRDEFLKSKGDLQEMQNSFLRMRQVCSGFLTLKGEDDEKHRVSFYTNPKLNALEDILDSLPSYEKVMVFHEFILSGNTIQAMLERKKIKHARIGGTSHNRPGLSMQRFLRDPSVRVLLANNHSSGATTGTNPHKVCRRQVYFDLPVDPITRTQAVARVRRMGQEKHVYIHDLLISGSVDEMVQKFLAQGKSLFDAIINGEAKL